MTESVIVSSSDNLNEAFSSASTSKEIDTVLNKLALLHFTNLPGNKVAESFEEAKSQIESLIKQARVDELKSIVSQSQIRNWNTATKHKLYGYYSDRLAELEGDK